jgi:cellulose biosynthesis protein BcsQ
MKVITFSIFKGGTGKTTSAVNTAAALVRKGKRVLLADLDQSAQSTKHLGTGQPAPAGRIAKYRYRGGIQCRPD